MRVKTVLVALGCALVALAPVAALAKPSPKKPKAKYYLALGDSLARGVQPNASGKSVPTNKGYATDLYKVEKKKLKGLKFKDLGCPGETTKTMMNGGTCHYAQGNQLAAAVKFLKSHKGHIAFVTIDIGANDVDNCVTKSGTIDGTCLAAGEQSIKTNVPKIAAALRKAGGKKVKIAGMTYYDPFLAFYLKGGSGKALAQASQGLAKQINKDITNGYTPSNVKIADVAATFRTYTPFTGPGSQNATYKGQTVPVAVARICQWTWMCAPAPRGPNIHANATGYKQLAKTFKKSIL
jgi:lysophospholipase L1-like esterase